MYCCVTRSRHVLLVYFRSDGLTGFLYKYSLVRYFLREPSRGAVVGPELEPTRGTERAFTALRVERRVEPVAPVIASAFPSGMEVENGSAMASSLHSEPSSTTGLLCAVLRRLGRFRGMIGRFSRFGTYTFRSRYG